MLRFGGANLAGAALLGAYGCGGSADRGETSGGTRPFEHALGETEVPTEPDRVVRMYTLVLAAILGVGTVEPVRLDAVRSGRFVFEALQPWRFASYLAAFEIFERMRRLFGSASGGR